MKMEITETDQDTLLINGKECYKTGQSWHSRVELTNDEKVALLEYVNKDTPKPTPVNRIFNEVLAERLRQDEKFGSNRDHHPFAWLAILGEEVGEVNKAALETYFNYPDASPDYTEYRAELIQVAAVAVSMIECIDRQYGK